jgi:hypothetical protein
MTCYVLIFNLDYRNTNLPPLIEENAMDWELAQTVFTVICVYVFLKMIDNMIVKRDNRADDMALRIELLEDRVAKAGLGSGEASMRELKAIARTRTERENST